MAILPWPVDLLVNRQDGLGAHVHYLTDFVRVQAEFEHPPLRENQFSLVVFNASFHYSINDERTLAWIKPLLVAQGKVVIMDSPIYRDEVNGRKMVDEREEQYLKAFGFASNSIPNENFLILQRLRKLSTTLGLQWTLIRPFYGFDWHMRPLKAWIRGRREHAHFHLILGDKTGSKGFGQNGQELVEGAA